MGKNCFAQQKGARRVYLVSNTKLGQALGLYRKHGFETTRLGPKMGPGRWLRGADMERGLTLPPTRSPPASE